MKLTSFSTFCGSLRIKQWDGEGSVGPSEHATMDVRRVKNDRNGEHAQISLAVGKNTGKRRLEQSYTLTLDPAQIDLLVTALTKLRPKHDGVYRTFAEERKFDAKFFGLKEDA